MATARSGRSVDSLRIQQPQGADSRFNSMAILCKQAVSLRTFRSAAKGNSDYADAALASMICTYISTSNETCVGVTIGLLNRMGTNTRNNRSEDARPSPPLCRNGRHHNRGLR